MFTKKKSRRAVNVLKFVKNDRAFPNMKYCGSAFQNESHDMTIIVEVWLGVQSFAPCADWTDA